MLVHDAPGEVHFRGVALAERPQDLKLVVEDWLLVEVGRLLLHDVKRTLMF